MPLPFPAYTAGRGDVIMNLEGRTVHRWGRRVISGLAALLLVAGTARLLLFLPGPSVSTLAGPPQLRGTTVVIDAGHGGEDGGAVSPAGTVESGINLEIALRLDAVLALYGTDTVLLRTEDVSLHDPEARTLREKKASDLRNRAQRVEAIPNSLLVSIHQNTYTGSGRYHGAQVFYADAETSGDLARHTQEILRRALDPENTRQAAKLPNTVYLMDHITCPAILVECGFLSNPEEDALLRTAGYQTKLAAALASALLSPVPAEGT